MHKIRLNDGYSVIVDDRDYQAVVQHRWFVVKREHLAYAAAAINQNGKQKFVYMHRYILNTLPGLHIDHRNRNGLDNRRRNLRVCTVAENIRNQRVSKCNTSGFKGVSWAVHTKRWRSTINKDGRQTHIGYFNDPISAAIAYNTAALRLHGAFALLNEIPGSTK